MSDALKQLFNEDWYLEAYVDVARSGQDAWEHYLNFGRFEERWPAPLLALTAEASLWQGNEAVLPELERLALKADAQAEIARWALARWNAYKRDWAAVVHWLGGLADFTLLLQVVPHAGPYLCLFEAYVHLAKTTEAMWLLDSDRWPAYSALQRHNKTLAQSMLLNGDAKLGQLNKLYRDCGFAELTFKVAGTSFDALASTAPAMTRRLWQSKPLVTVIFPCYNCATTLPTAVNSVLQQSWHKLQVILVDDASTDDTWQVMSEFAAADNRVECVQLKENEGAYGARNAGLDSSKGQFITTHDADDWSHPQKIAHQVTALLNNKTLMATRSAWVRADEKLNFSRWRPESTWIYPNVSSLMFRRRALKRLGYWDAVSADGDTEFYYRLQTVFGASAIAEVLAEVPLAFGRVSEGSLTQQSRTHLKTQLGGVRADYQQASQQWHQAAGKNGLYLSRYPKRRPFLAPLAICRGTQSARQHNQIEQIKNSQYFDADYYLERYPDIAEAGIEPARHYTLFGAAEGRDPGCLFSSSAYRFIRSLSDDENPLLSFLAGDDIADPLSLFKGNLVALNDDNMKPLLLVVAHSTAGDAFGAEKSLLDVLDMLRGEFRLWVVLPSAFNEPYVRDIEQAADAVSFLPIRWWNAKRSEDTSLIEVLAEWMQEQQVAAVYVNTLTLDEPHKAARRAGLPVFCHVRELPQADPDLCAALEADAEAIRLHTLNQSDSVIANSKTVDDYLQAADRVVVIPNVIDVKHFKSAAGSGVEKAADEKGSEQRLTVGMLSSNVAKKGITDFYEIADALYNSGHYDFVLYGPATELVSELTQQFPGAVTHKGYVDDPASALRELDVVLNLSHFQESFGRSVLEAMAAQRVVIAYNWGAIPELLTDGCGVLAPYKDKQAVIKTLERLYQHPDELKRLGVKAFERAKEFAPAKVEEQLIATLKRNIMDKSSMKNLKSSMKSSPSNSRETE